MSEIPQTSALVQALQQDLAPVLDELPISAEYPLHFEPFVAEETR